MFGGLKPYPAMKDSGVPWLGSVPEHWGLVRLKYLLREHDVRSCDGAEQLLRVSQYTGVTERKREDGGDEPDTRAASLVGYKRVEPADLVVNIMLAWNGSMGVSPYSGIASPAYCVYRFGAKAVPWYYHHLLRSPIYKARIKAVSTGVVESRLRLYTDDLNRLEALLPPRPEQASIVRFLDSADRRIRQNIRAKQKLIKLLEEQKQVIIHRAVTRGLEPNVRLKPSGVEWLGDLPAHWRHLPLKRIVTIDNSGSYGSEPEDGEVVLPVATTAQINSKGQFSVEKMPVRGFSRRDAERYGCNPGDILVVKSSGSIFNVISGKAGIVRPDTPHFAFSNFLLRVVPSLADVEPEYLFFLLSGYLTRERVKRMVAGSTYPNLQVGEYASAPLPLPPLDEQRHVVLVVRDKTAALDRTCGRIERQIALLHELRVRLIADVVTGKLDVREAAARLSDTTDKTDGVDEADIQEAVEEVSEDAELASVTEEPEG